MTGLPMLADFARLPYTYNQTGLGWASYLMICTRGSFGFYLLVELLLGREEQICFFLQLDSPSSIRNPSSCGLEPMSCYP